MTGQQGVVRRGSALLLGLLLLPVVLAGCGSGAPRTPPTGAAPTGEGVGTVTVGPDGVQNITLQVQDDYVFTPDHFTVAPGKVHLTVVSVATQMTHNLEFPSGGGPQKVDASISLIGPGDQGSIDFDVETPGDYRFECGFHVQLGQVGTMTVRG